MVPQLEGAFGADHGHALGQVVHGALQQARLLRQGLLAAHGFADLQFGDVGVEDHQPAFAGGPFADLHPAPVVQAVEAVLVVAAALFFDDQPGALGQATDLVEAGAADDSGAAAGPEGFEAAVEQDDALLGVEQDEGVGDALDGVHQVLVGGLGTQAGIAEQAVAGLEFGHGLVQRVGAFTHLFGQHHGMLEGGIGPFATGSAGFHPFDQGGVDAPQLGVLPLQLGEPGALFSVRHGGCGGRWRRR